MTLLARRLLAAALLLWGLAAVAEEVAPAAINGRFLLMNHYGEMVSDRDFGDRFQLVYFGYTHCPDVCPTSLVTITQALKLLGERAERIQPLFITVDPERDTIDVLREYVGFFHPRLVGLTGSAELIQRAAENFRVRYEKVQIPGAPADDYQMDHSAGVFLMAPDGRFLVKFAHGIPAADMVRRLEDFL